MELPLAEIREENGVAFAYYPSVGMSLPVGPGGEERVRVAIYNLLLTKYEYPARRINLQVPVKIRDDERARYADLVVYDDDHQRRPLIVVEVKGRRRQDGERQAQRYATILRAVYTLWSNGVDPMTASILVNRYPEEAVAIPDIPSFGGDVQFRITSLKPFHDDNAVRSAIRKCHDVIRNHDNKKPDQAFEEFLKVLVVKFNDERQGTEFLFQVLLRGSPPRPEDPNTTAQRIRAMFQEAIGDEGTFTRVFPKHDDIHLTNETIVQIVMLLQACSFSFTDVDHKARAFETFLSNDLRQELKEFMTPRPVIHAVVEMADPRVTDHILDPCCGTGGFLIAALDHVRRAAPARKLTAAHAALQRFDFVRERLCGLDSSPQMVSAARLNMLVNDDGHAQICHVQDALDPHGDAAGAIGDRRFDLIMTNPPFGQRINGPARLLTTFGVIRTYARRQGGFLSEVLFLERNIERLKPGGRLFIVLPDSVLGNTGLAAARRFIEQRARLVAVISLSADTFGPSGAKSKTSVVVLERRAEVLEQVGVAGDVFLADVRQIGHDFTGRATAETSQLPAVVAAFRRWKADGGIAPSAIARVVPRAALGTVWLAGPQFTKAAEVPRPHRRPRRRHDWSLGEICSHIGIGKTARRAEYATSGLHMVKVGNLTGRGIQWGCVERQFVAPPWAERHPDAVLKAHDILFTAAAHGPKWIGLKVDVFTHVPPRVGTISVFCAELMRVRLETDAELDPFYVTIFLRSAAGYAEIQRCIRGQSGHVYKDQVREIRIPQPDRSSVRRVADAIATFKAALNAQAQSQQCLDASDDLARGLFPSSVSKPIIAR